MYEKPFWPENLMGYEMVWTPGENGVSFESLLNVLKNQNEKTQTNWHENIYSFETVKYHSNILCVWLYGCEYHESLSDEEIKFDCSRLLRRFLGRHDVPEPVEVLRSRWNSNKYFRGSYSYSASGSSTADIKSLAQPMPSIDVSLYLKSIYFQPNTLLILRSR